MTKSIISLWLIAGFAFPLTAAPPAVEQWMSFETAVRDGKIEKAQAREELPRRMSALKKWGETHPFGEEHAWVFPIQGYGLSSIGGKNGNGFKPHIVYGASPIKGYDFFDGNRHGGHPAQDIFIRDANQDSLDDRTGLPVPAVAMIDALVIGVVADWEPGNALRGGNVVWLYHPHSQQLHYYAHLNTLLVQPGDRVKAGQPIGTVGRTGFSAQEPRSPTHLHLMVLEFNGKTLAPVNFFANLRDQEKKSK